MTTDIALKLTSNWRAYFEMCKPRVVLLMLITSYVGMHFATPGWVPLSKLAFGLLGIALMAGGAAAVNHVVDHQIDAIMARTRLRPLPTGKVSTQHALVFAGILSAVGFMILWWGANPLTAILTFITLIGYAVVYTIFLKRTTPQNIVLGGLAGAMPPLLGWTAITGGIDPHALLLVAIIFVWTPPHFWALAIYRYHEYAKVEDVPMLPVTHGIPLTKLHILLYTILLIVVSWLPFITGMNGILYFIGATVLGSGFLYHALKLKFSDDPTVGRSTFRYSIVYLFLLFVLMFIDHAI